MTNHTSYFVGSTCCVTYQTILVFRLMSTVLLFFSVKCASGNYQILKGVINKSQWSQIVCFVPLYGDVFNQILRQDQIWKRSLKNSRNQFNGMTLLHCYAQTTCKFDYPRLVCFNGTRFLQQLT